MPLPTSHLTGSGGLPHAARLYAADTATGRGALLVLAHGAGAGQSHPFMVRYAQGLAERGLDIVTFDFPYMEAGRRAPDRAPVLEEAFRRVVAAAGARPQLNARRLFIGGKSMGGRMATHVAAAPDLWPEHAPPLAGVVVFGYPLNPPGGASKRSPDRVSHLARIAVPVLIVQGTRDTFGGPDAIRAAMPHAIVHDVAGGDHSPAARYDQAVLDGVAAFVSAT
ncbi:MAG TPA: alpha/beta fold hydrolase [Vicinamibacterales bacterium]|nr:alpha/beta fold hydrolase [Vicinamibacterales bacterium]